jgi:hypothetical protein
LQQIIATDPLTDAAAGLRGQALGLNLVLDVYYATRRIKADPALRLISIFGHLLCAQWGRTEGACGWPIGISQASSAESGKSPSRQWSFPALGQCRANIFYAAPGWLVGAGVEYAFTQNWTATLEYDFLGLNNASYTIAVPGVGNDTFSTRNRDVQMLTVGVNYLFTGEAAQ